MLKNCFRSTDRIIQSSFFAGSLLWLIVTSIRRARERESKRQITSQFAGRKLPWPTICCCDEMKTGDRRAHTSFTDQVKKKNSLRLRCGYRMRGREGKKKRWIDWKIGGFRRWAKKGKKGRIRWRKKRSGLEFFWVLPPEKSPGKNPGKNLLGSKFSR